MYVSHQHSVYHQHHTSGKHTTTHLSTDPTNPPTPTKPDSGSFLSNHSHSNKPLSSRLAAAKSASIGGSKQQSSVSPQSSVFGSRPFAGRPTSLGHNHNHHHQQSSGVSSSQSLVASVPLGAVPPTSVNRVANCGVGFSTTNATAASTTGKNTPAVKFLFKKPQLPTAISSSAALYHFSNTNNGSNNGNSLSGSVGNGNSLAKFCIPKVSQKADLSTSVTTGGTKSLLEPPVSSRLSTLYNHHSGKNVVNGVSLVSAYQSQDHSLPFTFNKHYGNQSKSKGTTGAANLKSSPSSTVLKSSSKQQQQQQESLHFASTTTQQHNESKSSKASAGANVALVNTSSSANSSAARVSHYQQMSAKAEQSNKLHSSKVFSNTGNNTRPNNPSGVSFTKESKESSKDRLSFVKKEGVSVKSSNLSKLSKSSRVETVPTKSTKPQDSRKRPAKDGDLFEPVPSPVDNLGLIKKSNKSKKESKLVDTSVKTKVKGLPDEPSNAFLSGKSFNKSKTKVKDAKERVDSRKEAKKKGKKDMSNSSSSSNDSDSEVSGDDSSLEQLHTKQSSKQAMLATKQARIRRNSNSSAASTGLDSARASPYDFLYSSQSMPKARLDDLKIPKLSNKEKERKRPPKDVVSSSSSASSSDSDSDQEDNDHSDTETRGTPLMKQSKVSPTTLGKAQPPPRQRCNSNTAALSVAAGDSAARVSPYGSSSYQFLPQTASKVKVAENGGGGEAKSHKHLSKTKSDKERKRKKDVAQNSSDSSSASDHSDSDSSDDEVRPVKSKSIKKHTHHQQQHNSDSSSSVVTGATYLPSKSRVADDVIDKNNGTHKKSKSKDRKASKKEKKDKKRKKQHRQAVSSDSDDSVDDASDHSDDEQSHSKSKAKSYRRRRNSSSSPPVESALASPYDPYSNYSLQSTSNSKAVEDGKGYKVKNNKERPQKEDKKSKKRKKKDLVSSDSSDDSDQPPSDDEEVDYRHKAKKRHPMDSPLTTDAARVSPYDGPGYMYHPQAAASMAKGSMTKETAPNMSRLSHSNAQLPPNSKQRLSESGHFPSLLHNNNNNNLHHSGLSPSMFGGQFPPTSGGVNHHGSPNTLVPSPLSSVSSSPGGLSQKVISSSKAPSSSSAHNNPYTDNNSSNAGNSGGRTTTNTKKENASSSSKKSSKMSAKDMLNNSSGTETSHLMSTKIKYRDDKSVTTIEIKQINKETTWDSNEMKSQRHKSTKESTKSSSSSTSTSGSSSAKPHQPSQPSNKTGTGLSDSDSSGDEEKESPMPMHSNHHSKSADHRPSVSPMVMDSDKDKTRHQPHAESKRHKLAKSKHEHRDKSGGRGSSSHLSASSDSDSSDHSSGESMEFSSGEDSDADDHSGRATSVRPPPPPVDHRSHHKHHSQQQVHRSAGVGGSSSASSTSSHLSDHQASPQTTPNSVLPASNIYAKTNHHPPTHLSASSSPFERLYQNIGYGSHRSTNSGSPSPPLPHPPNSNTTSSSTSITSSSTNITATTTTTNSSSTVHSSGFTYVELRDIQLKVTQLSSPEVLQQVVDLIEKRNYRCFNIVNNCLQFDLLKLDYSTLLEIRRIVC